MRPKSSLKHTISASRMTEVLILGLDRERADNLAAVGSLACVKVTGRPSAVWMSLWAEETSTYVHLVICTRHPRMSSNPIQRRIPLALRENLNLLSVRLAQIDMNLHSMVRNVSTRKVGPKLKNAPYLSPSYLVSAHTTLSGPPPRRVLITR